MVSRLGLVAGEMGAGHAAEASETLASGGGGLYGRLCSSHWHLYLWPCLCEGAFPVCPQLHLSTQPGPGIQTLAHQWVNGWMRQAVVIFRVHDKQHGCQAGSVQDGARGVDLQAPCCAGPWGYLRWF